MARRKLLGLGFGLFFLSGLISYLGFHFTPRFPQPDHLLSQAVPTRLPTPSPTPDPLAPQNILLLGYAGPNHDGGNLTDTLIVAHLDPKAKTVTLISVPRDLWVTLPLSATNRIDAKINAAWAIGNDDRHYPDKISLYQGNEGGLHLATTVAQQVTGLPIHYVVAVNFQGFEDILKLIGPLTVSVPYTFDDAYYPITGKETDTCGKSPEDIQALTATMSGETLERQFTCRYEPLHFDQGKVTLDPSTALKFVRSRHSDIGGGDFGRSARQQALLAAIKDQLFQLSTLPKIIPLAETILKNVRTNIDLALIQKWLTLYPPPSAFTLSSLTLNQKELISNGVSRNGQYILQPVAGQNDFSLIRQFLAASLASPSAILIRH